MGVGVYRDDFKRTGGTINVDGPLTSEEDYNSYVKTIMVDSEGVVAVQAEDGYWNYHRQSDGEPSSENADDVDYLKNGRFETEAAAYIAAAEEYDVGVPSDFEAYARDEYDTQNMHLIETIERAARALDAGVNVCERSGFRGPRAAFDAEFVGVFNTGDMRIGAGWRSWEHDFVVGLAANESERGGLRDELAYVDDYAAEILSRTGRAPQALARLHDEVTSDLLTYLRVALQKEGFTCTFPTSGYTSEKYSAPENFDDTLSDLRSRIKANLAELSRPAEEVVLNQDASARAETIKALHSLSLQSDVGDPRFQLSVPMFDTEVGIIRFFDPLDGAEKGFARGARIGSEIPGYQEMFRDLPTVEGLVAIPRNEHTEAWFVSGQERRTNSGRGLSLMVSAEEFSAATGAGLRLSFDRAAADARPLLVSAIRVLAGESEFGDSEAVREKCREIANVLQHRGDESSKAVLTGLDMVIDLTQPDYKRSNSADLTRNIGLAIDATEALANEAELTVMKKKSVLPAPRP